MVFSEAWLAQYQARMASATQNNTTFIHFDLSKPTPLLNVVLRQHWAARKKAQKALSAEIAAHTPNLRGMLPMQRARVEVTRYSVKEPDLDGLQGGMKGLIDCLLVRSDRHPEGLGFIVDDSPDHLELTARSVRVSKRTEQRTTVSIERLA